ncbi:hypothetical protein [Jannaschia sp. LMIT008]|uniref:hypothetical protein n=1 Tax=Jannaschia maritima TaxID=3032585 RepID=UPI00281259F6|nr:hypothetical protein [Jannaschia sp. LMIT008]
MEKTRAKMIVFEERNRKAIFTNERNRWYQKGQIDGCLIDDHRERCDGYVSSNQRIWLIELKGEGVEKACSQIAATSKNLPEHIGEREIIAVVVATKCPAVSGQQKHLRKLKKMRGRFNNRVILRTRKAIINLDAEQA